MGLLKDADNDERLGGLEWWRLVDGAQWDQPEGPNSEIGDRVEHPATQVSWRDAAAFASWAGGRLPKEAEWDFAALGGQTAARFPWGDAEPDDNTTLPCNNWESTFPNTNGAHT